MVLCVKERCMVESGWNGIHCYCGWNSKNGPLGVWQMGETDYWILGLSDLDGGFRLLLSLVLWVGAWKTQNFHTENMCVGLPHPQESTPQFWTRISLPPFLGKSSSLGNRLALLPYGVAQSPLMRTLWMIPPSLSTSQG